MTEAFLQSIGIDVESAVGEVEYTDGRANIGLVILGLSGRVRAVPHNGLTAFQRTTLLAVASKVWSSGRGCLGSDAGWQYDPEIGWVAGVQVRQRPDVIAAVADGAEGPEADR